MSSLYGALFSGVSGLQAQSNAMGAIADNVSNVNTVGYKGTDTQFQTLVTQQASRYNYTAGGVQARPRMNIEAQGLLQSTSGSNDVGIAGNGFFVVSTQPSGGGYFFTRAGAFQTDANGYYQNTAGYYLQGWPLQPYDPAVDGAGVETVEVEGVLYKRAYTNSDGITHPILANEISSDNMRPLNVGILGGTAQGTANIRIGLTLNADAAVGGTNSSTNVNVPMYDTLGISHTLNYVWNKVGTNKWDTFVTPPQGAYSSAMRSQPAASTPDGGVYSSSGRIDFTSIPANGSSFTINIGGSPFTINYTNAATDLTNLAAINIDVSGTQTLSQIIANTTQAIELASRSVYAGLYPTPAGTTGTVAEVSGGKNIPTAWATSDTSNASVLINNGGELPIQIDMRLMRNSIGQSAVRQVNPLNATGTAVATAWEIPGLTLTDLNPGDARANGQWAGAWINRNQGGVLVASQDNDPNYPCAMQFNGNGGTINRIFGYDQLSNTDPTTTITIDWANGASRNQVINQDFGNYNTSSGLKQLNGAFEEGFKTQDGKRFGTFQDIEITDTGIVIAKFDNGVRTPIFQIPLATFMNTNGLGAVSGNLFIDTSSSGGPTLRQANTGSTGATQQGVLEASTSDIGTEFTDMIITQRAYSASTKIITTADDMLDELVRLKR